jgi:FG-GAP-like repeat
MAHHVHTSVSLAERSNRAGFFRRRFAGAAICFCFFSLASSAAELKWTHFTIEDPLPGNGAGTAGIPLADLDRDGDLDAALSRAENGDAHGFWWYERKSDSVWVQHLINDSINIMQGLGAAALDVDNDGWTDLVFDQAWFRNPGTLRKNPDSLWEAQDYEHSGHEVHDIIAADINGDGRQDIVTFDGNKLLWYDTAHSLAVTLVAQGIGHHGGIAPHGAGDMDGDGDTDLVITGSWFENRGKEKGKWIRHPWPYLPIPKACYGISIRSWVVDLDGEGDNDIVYRDCDTGFGHLCWARNEGKGQAWTRFPLADPPTSRENVPGTGSWHSLGVADFNGDGRPDIFSGEQEDPKCWAAGGLTMKPQGLKPRGVIWVNCGANPPIFAPQIIHEGNPGWHDVCIGDLDGDGDVDIVSKIWCKDGPTDHADYWRNDTMTNRK